MSENVYAESLDLRVKRSRKNLIDALLALMQEQPFQKITVQDITEQAMVNRSTFYAHFKDKYDLFSTAIGYRLRHDLAKGLGDSSGFNYANLHRLILVSGDLMSRISNDCKPTSVDELIPLIMTEMQNSIFDVVRAWTDDLGGSEAEARTLAMFAAGTIFGSVVLWGQSSYSKQTVNQLAEQLMPLLMNGVSQYSA